ncbi:MAG: hypothetical protein HY606_14095 [Planctomycetes bacterium]|nr:hypothetical protein [Planctomycetota bacterium]
MIWSTVILFLLQTDNPSEVSELRITNEQRTAVIATVVGKIETEQGKIKQFASPILTLLPEATGFNERIVVKGNIGIYDEESVILKDAVSISSSNATMKGRASIIVWKKDSNIVMGDVKDINNKSELFFKDIYIESATMVFSSTVQTLLLSANKISKFVYKSHNTNIDSTSGRLSLTFKNQQNTYNADELNLIENVTMLLNGKKFMCEGLTFFQRDNSGILNGNPHVQAIEKDFIILSPIIKFKNDKLTAFPPVLIDLQKENVKLLTKAPLNMANNRIFVRKTRATSPDKRSFYKNISIAEGSILVSGYAVVESPNLFLVADSAFITDSSSLFGTKLVASSPDFYVLSSRVEFTDKDILIGMENKKTIFFKRRK